MEIVFVLVRPLMKRRLDLSKLLLASMVLTFASCKDQEFYEKDMYETFQEKYEQELEDQVNDSQNGSNSGDNGAGSGSTGSGSGDDGSGSGDNGSGDNGSGCMTNCGSGDNGSGDNGSGDNGSGDNGSGDNGSGDNGSGDNGSGDNGSGDDDVTLEAVTEVFSQQAEKAKMDILWVIDNSGSMQDEQAALAYNFDVFIQDFITKGIDFKMGITTTDTTGNKAGRPVYGSLDQLTSTKLAENENQFLNDFSDMIQVGIKGSGYEKGIAAAEAFSNNHAPNAFRNDAYYVVVFVSDEDDQSAKTAPEHLNSISGWKSNNALVKFYSIVNMSKPMQPSNWHTPGYDRYKAITDLTGGLISDINEDFYTTLQNMGESIAKLTESFALNGEPYNNSVKVFVNDVEQIDGWVYDEVTRTLSFQDGFVPAVGSEIRIEYLIKK
jgi:hypothetical protein